MLGLRANFFAKKNLGPKKMLGPNFKKNDDSVKEAPAYCQSFLDGLPKGFVTLCDVL